MFPNIPCTDCDPCPTPVVPVPIPDLSELVCSIFYDDTCVFYSGEDIPCAGILNGMFLNEVLQILSNTSCTYCGGIPKVLQPLKLTKDVCGRKSDSPSYELVYVYRPTGVFSDVISNNDIIYESDRITKYVGNNLIYGARTFDASRLTIININDNGIVTLNTTIASITPAPESSNNEFNTCVDATVNDLILSIIGTDIKIYDDPYLGNPLPLTDVLTETYYLATQTLYGCESTFTWILVSVGTVYQPEADSPQTFCTNSTVANLVAYGDNIKWYTALTGGTLLANTTQLVSGVTYYCSQTTGTCESEIRTAVLATIGIPSTPIAVNQTFCSVPTPTIADLVVTGTTGTVKWYTTAIGGTALSSGTNLISGTTYYVSQTIGSCESAKKSISIIVTTKVTPLFTQVSNVCSGVTMIPLPTTSTNGITGTWSPALNNTTNTLYTFTPTTGLCANTTTMTIGVDTVATPTVSAQTFCGGGTVSNLVATGTNLKWYNVATGGTALYSSVPLVTGTYYVSQTLGICESARVSCAVTTSNFVFSLRNAEHTTYSDGTPIPQITNNTEWTTDPSTGLPRTTGAWCYYNNDPANGAVYGKLYNWYAVAGIYNAASLANPVLRKQFAPNGYRVPTFTEGYNFINCLGGTSVAGGKMKEAGTTHWQSPNTDATNSSGFTGLPGGYRNYNGPFYNINLNNYYFFSTENELHDSNGVVIEIQGAVMYLDYRYSVVNLSGARKSNGMSIRLIADI